jgi:dienelactone hydrolase
MPDRQVNARLCAAVAAAALGVLPAPATAQFSPGDETKNYSKINERAQHEHMLPDYRVMLAQRSGEQLVDGVQGRVRDPERDTSGNLCQRGVDGCAGDVRFYDWQQQGYGLRIPLLWTARNGAVISGHVWATRHGPAKRPGVVITTGSVQAPETLYGFAAAALAKRGFVVLTYDVQGQGRSDTYGEGADRNEGVPSQSGQPFHDGTEDALDFLFSSPASPYRPRKSCSTGTDHSPKHLRRVQAGLNAAYNPLSHMLDVERIGVAGHSLGAGAVSYIGQLDSRVKAIVAWDNLRDSQAGVGGFGSQSSCPSGSSPRPNSVPLRVPALGMSADYGLTPTPYTSAPDPQTKNAASSGYTARARDTAQLNIRGGTHYEWSYLPHPAFGATLRGMDMAAWYTWNWMERYVERDPSADRRLLTTRWHADSGEAAVDPDRDGNHYSKYLRSRIDIRTAAGRVRCEDLRSGTAGCGALSANDGEPPNYSYLRQALTPDTPANAPRDVLPAGGSRFSQRVRVNAPRLASDAGTGPRFAVRVAARGARSAALDHYELQVQQLPGGRFRRIGGRIGTAARSVAGRRGRAYRFRGRAIGRGGVPGPWAYATSVVPVDERSARFTGPWWSRAASRGAFDGTLTRAADRGVRMRFVFRGSRVWIIGRRSPQGGRALTLLDGRPRVIDFHARRARDRAVIASLAARGRGRHTLLVFPLGYLSRTGRPLIELDALGVSP